MTKLICPNCSVAMIEVFVNETKSVKTTTSKCPKCNYEHIIEDKKPTIKTVSIKDKA